MAGTLGRDGFPVSRLGPAVDLRDVRDEQCVEGLHVGCILEGALRNDGELAAADKPRISCTIGERMWQERWGGFDFR